MQNIKLKKFIAAATLDEQRKIAEAASINIKYLPQLANGARQAKAELAGLIADAIATLRLSNPNLPRITRGDISRACKVCPYYVQCASAEISNAE